MSYWADKRVVVTGGSGFLGSHVVAKLRAAKCRDVFVVRSADYNLTREDDVARLFTDLERQKSGPSEGGSQQDGRVDVVIHLAGLVGGIGANKAFPADYFYQNLMMGTLVTHYSWKHGVRKFVAAGAGCGYPEHANMPLKEETFWDGFPQVESFPYSLAKRMLHVQALAYGRQHGFKAVVCVPGNIYGPFDNFDLEQAHVIPALVRRFVEAVDDAKNCIVVWGSGAPTRDFVYGGDVADGILRAVEVYNEPTLVNLASGIDTSVLDVVSILKEITGFQGQIAWDSSRPDGQRKRRFDVSKAARELEWTARTDLREGLGLTVDWYRKNRQTARR